MTMLIYSLRNRAGSRMHANAALEARMMPLPRRPTGLIRPKNLQSSHVTVNVGLEPAGRCPSPPCRLDAMHEPHDGSRHHPPVMWVISPRFDGSRPKVRLVGARGRRLPSELSWSLAAYSRRHRRESRDRNHCATIGRPTSSGRA